MLHMFNKNMTLVMMSYSSMSILQKIITTTNKMKFRVPALVIILPHVATTKNNEHNLDYKSIVIVSENSEHNRVTSMSCLKKVIKVVKECMAKKFKRLIIWSDEMGAQFRSPFVFKILSSSLFMEKELSWYYNERHYGKGPMDGVGGTLKNVVFRQVKSNKVVIYTPEEFAQAAMKFVPSIQTFYLPKESKITEPEGIESAPLIKETLKIHKLERFINNRGESSIKFYNTAADEEPLHTKWYSKAGALICGHKESNVGDDHCANCFDLYCENGIDWLQCPACKKWFHETCFYV